MGGESTQTKKDLRQITLINHTFFDVRVFNPFARRYSGLTLSQAYRTNENEKKRLYNDRVMSVEHGTFTP